jgi:hypothetical protein
LQNLFSANEYFPAQAACLIRVPTEVIKTRMQTSMYGASTSSFKAATLVLQHDGVRGFYRGFLTTIMREVNECILTLYECSTDLASVFPRYPLHHSNSRYTSFSNIDYQNIWIANPYMHTKLLSVGA